MVEKFDKFHHHWQMYLLNFTVSPYFCVYVHEIHFLGSGPERGRSPVEWGEILYLCPSVRPYIRTSPLASPLTPLAGPQTPLAGPQTPLAGPQTPLADLQLALKPL